MIFLLIPMSGTRGWNFEAGTSKESAKKIWNFERVRLELRILDLELRKNEVPKKLELRSFEVPIFNFRKVTIPSQKLRMFNVFAENFFWNFECSKFQLFWNFECLKIQWKLSHSKFQNLQNFEYFFGTSNFEFGTSNIRSPTPYVRHCFIGKCGQNFVLLDDTLTAGLVLVFFLRLRSRLKQGGTNLSMKYSW